MTKDTNDFSRKCLIEYYTPYTWSIEGIQWKITKSN